MKEAESKLARILLAWFSIALLAIAASELATARATGEVLINILAIVVAAGWLAVLLTP